MAIKGLQLAQSDLERDALDQSRLGKMRDTVIEFVNDLSDQTDQEPTGERATADAEAAAAVEAAVEPIHADLPILQRDQLPSNGKATTPSCALPAEPRSTKPPGSCSPNSATSTGCGARGRAGSVVDQQYFSIGKRRCRSGLPLLPHASNPAQIRYAVRRLRRKLPQARIMLGCWSIEADRTAPLLEATKADVVAHSLREATRICVEAAQRGGVTTPPEREVQPASEAAQ